MPNQLDAIAFMRRVHMRLSALAEVVATRSETPDADHAFDEWAKCLGGHLRAMESIVLPALTGLGWVDTGNEVRAAHVCAQAMMAELLSTPPLHPQYEATRTLALSAMGEVIRVDQHLVIPQLQERMRHSARLLLAAEMQLIETLIPEDPAEPEPLA
ncbi:hypothetical protein [Ideonella sp. BN130291]|uniref:hypothetical protein n=1 Tax=Ideonella sp. BN130291 TaxID=3112940 RepID=UPI002E256F66|nr:hypothetical protein [Ideonella sp. BN130291]